MRHTIWKKDDFFAYGKNRIDMDPNVVELPDQVPLVWQFNYSDPGGLFGHVSELRVEDGEITGEVFSLDPTFNPDLMEEQDMRLGGSYYHIETTDGGSRVTKCTLKAVSVINIPASPLFKEN